MIVPLNGGHVDIPTSTAAVAVLVALFVPGLVYSTIRASLTGYRGTDRSLGSRFAHAVTVGVVLNAAYLALCGRVAYESFGFDAGREQVVVADPVGARRTIPLLGLVAPAVLAALAHAVPWWRIPGAQRIMDWASAQGLLVVNRVPTTWDHAGHQQNGVFVRVTRADGMDSTGGGLDMSTSHVKAVAPQVGHTETLGYSPQASVANPKPPATTTGVVRPKH